RLHITMPGLTAGYIGNPELTSGRYRMLDVDSQRARFYDSGDEVRYDVEGLLHFIGRRDGQVKIRGHRVEVGEVEAAICRRPSIADAVVVAAEDDRGSRDLHAYVRWRREAD